MIRCASCLAPITGESPDIWLIVERVGGHNSIYCTACAPTLIGLGEVIDDAREMRRILARGEHLMFEPRPMVTDEFGGSE
jgi:hypothetical protein